MKRLCVAALSLLLTGPAFANMAVRPDYIEMIEPYSDTLAEATVIASRLHTWRDAQGLHVCGVSYDVIIDDVLLGPAEPYKGTTRPGTRVTLARRPWSKEDSLLSRPALVRGGGRMAVGDTYVLGLRHDMLRANNYKLEDLARSLGVPGDGKALRCLKGLPKDFTDSGMQVFTEPAPSFGQSSGIPNEGRQYVRMPSQAAINDEAVIGAFREQFYRKTDKPDPAGRGFLTRDGIYPAGEAKPEYGAPYYLMDTGKNGATQIYFDYVVLYDDLKKMLRDPDRKPATRF